jgi:hypothetical protein
MLGRLWLAAALAISLASAQRGGGGRGRSMDMGFDTPIRAPRQSRLDRMADRLKLNKEQRTQAEGILDGAQKEALPVLETVIKARTAMAEAMVAERSPEEIDKLTGAYGEAAAQMAGVEAAAFAKIYATLKPNQQSKAGPAFEEMAGMFLTRDWRQAR